MDLVLLVEDVGRRLGSTPDASGACAAMRQLLLSRGLYSFLESSTASEGELRRLSQVSQVHPNGFAKIPLLRSPSGAKLVLHDWFSNGRESSEEIHNHRWSFCSAVLCGTVASQEFVESSNGPMRLNKYEYRSPDGGDTYSMLSLGEGRLAPRSTSVHMTGSIYCQPCKPLHQAQSAGSRALTLIVQGAVMENCTTVYSELPPVEDRTRPVRQSDTESVKVSVEQLMTSLRSRRDVK